VASPRLPRWRQVVAKAFDKYFRFVKYINVFTQLRRLKQFKDAVLKCVDGGYLVE